MSWAEWYVRLDGTHTSAPKALEGLAILVPEGDGYRRIEGTIGGETISFADVPAGRYFLEVPPPVPTGRRQLQEHQSSTVDLVWSYLRRGDAVLLDNSAPFTLGVDGLAPLQQDGDAELFLYSPEVELSQYESTPAVGGSSSATISTDLGYPAYAVEADRGDVLHVWQYESGMEGAPDQRPVYRATRLGRVTDLTVVPGSPVAAAVTLGPPPATASTSLELRGSQFAAAMGTLSQHPSRAWASVSYEVDPLAGTSMPGWAGPSVLSVGSELADVRLGTLTYPLPDAAWGTRRETTVSAEYPDLPGYSPQNPYRELAIYQYEDVDAGPVQLLIGPPRNLAVNGAALTGELLSGVGATPLLTWDAPAVGAADHYTVSIKRPGSAASGLLVVNLTERRLRVPSDVLQAGLNYRVQVIAYGGGPTAHGGATAHGWLFTP